MPGLLYKGETGLQSEHTVFQLDAFRARRQLLNEYGPFGHAVLTR
jgi:hypothetical protein